MAYHVSSAAKVVRLPTRTVAGVGLDLGYGVNVDLGGVTINTSDIANKIVGALWPPVEQKVNALVPVVANTAIDIAKQRAPELIEVAWPLIETKANKLIGTYEKRYLGMASAQFGPLQKMTQYTTPLLIGIGLMGLVVTAAALKTLKK